MKKILAALLAPALCLLASPASAEYPDKVVRGQQDGAL